MNKIFLSLGGFFGVLSIILGAFGAHFLKKILTESQLISFETGVRYQMYHAIVLIFIGYAFDFKFKSTQAMAYLFILGILFFSWSIFTLVFLSPDNSIKKIIGPITPIGGLFFIIGWILLIYNSITEKFFR